MAAPTRMLFSPKLISKSVIQSLLSSLSHSRPISTSCIHHTNKTNKKPPKDASQSQTDPKLDRDLVNAAKSAAASLPGNHKHTETDLLAQLLRNVSHTEQRRLEAEPRTEASPLTEPDSRGGRDERSQDVGPRQSPQGYGSPDRGIMSALLSEVSEGRRIPDSQYQQSDEDSERQHQRREGTEAGVRGGVTQQLRQEAKSMGLFDAEPLGIFTKPSTVADTTTNDRPTKPSLWDRVEAEHLHRLQTQAPRNEFEEMMKWTQEGKMWTFPIDNEQGWEEANIEFHEHVLLENLISDFPKTGPIRHFMELVVIGLGKNPYITVKDKHEHIQWFRKYFADKQHIFDELLQTDVAENN